MSNTDDANAAEHTSGKPGIDTSGLPDEVTLDVTGDPMGGQHEPTPSPHPAEETTEERPEEFYEDASVAGGPGESVGEAHGERPAGRPKSDLGPLPRVDPEAVHTFARETAGSLPDDPTPDAEPAPLSGEPAARADDAADAPSASRDASSAEDDDEEPAAPPPPVPGFDTLGLGEPILRALLEAGYVTPTPIQEQAIPVVLMGRDVLGCAQTGTGKTAGFTLPMLEILAGSRAKARMPRSLILEPTRELALQVAENFVKYGRHLNLVHALLIGGESMGDQRAVLDKGVDVLVATPGRLLDLFERGRILLADCKLLVIDEADRMLDMGFIPDVERIVSMLPPLRQTLFFSATMAPEIRKLADAFLRNPKEITVSRPASVAATITTGLILCQPHDKREALRRLLKREAVQNALIFCNRKRDVDVLYKSLREHGFSVGALHGDMDQSSRFATLNRFKAGEIQLLVCSDVAARGLDIGGLSHVFNFDVPFHAEDYVHRIGRTGRAGREGHAYTLATPDEAKLVGAVEKLTGLPIPRMVAVEGVESSGEADMAAAVGNPGAGRGRREERGSRVRVGPRPEDRARRGEGRDARPRREEAPREEASRVAEPRRVPVAAEPPPRGVVARGDRDAPARPEGERGGSRVEERSMLRRDDRSRDDMGPAVRGFGDSTPAFMLIPIPRPRREDPVGTPEAEAA